MSPTLVQDLGAVIVVFGHIISTPEMVGFYRLTFNNWTTVGFRRGTYASYVTVEGGTPPDKGAALTSAVKGD